jgi:hypothetical protein
MGHVERPITLDAWRVDAEAILNVPGDHLHVDVPAYVLLALIDTAEAAQAVINTWHAGVQPRTLQALEQTLNRYTRT